LDRAFGGGGGKFLAVRASDFADHGRFLFLSSFVLLSLSVVEEEKREKAGQNSKHRTKNSEPE